MITVSALFVVVFLLAFAYICSTDDVKQKYPDYKGEDLFEE